MVFLVIIPYLGLSVLWVFYPSWGRYICLGFALLAWVWILGSSRIARKRISVYDNLANVYLSFEEMDFFKQFALYYLYPMASKMYSSAFSGFTIISGITGIIFILKRHWIDALLSGLLYLLFSIIASQLNRPWFIYEAFKKKPNRWASEIPKIETLRRFWLDILPTYTPQEIQNIPSWSKTEAELREKHAEAFREAVFHGKEIPTYQEIVAQNSRNIPPEQSYKQEAGEKIKKAKQLLETLRKSHELTEKIQVDESIPETPTFCPTCGSKVASWEDLCPECGEFLSEDEEIADVTVALADHRKSIEKFRKLVLQDPNNYEYHHGLGMFLYLSDDEEGAEKEFREVIRLKPEFAEAHNELGQVLKKQGMYVDAERAYLEGIRLKPGVARHHYYLARCYALWGKKEEAIKSLQNALAGGFDDWYFMKTDDELNNIRDDPRFANLVEAVKQKSEEIQKYEREKRGETNGQKVSST
jgi:tetratricopeptide (TPR) repeat protein